MTSVVTVAKLKDFCKLASLSPCKGTKADILQLVDTYLKPYKYAPRYFYNLSPKEAWEKKFTLKYNELRETNTGSKSYEPIESDTNHQTKPSQYTVRWLAAFPYATSLETQSEVSGVPVDVLQRVYNKGLAAWRGGHHRPGASQHAWAMARVYSFLTKGKTFYFPDHKLVEEAMQRSERARKFWSVMSFEHYTPTSPVGHKYPKQRKV